MWKLLNLGEVVEIDGRSYTVDWLTEGNIGVLMRAGSPGPGKRMPSFPMLRQGHTVTIRKDEQERKARVLTVREGLTILGPHRMRDGQDGTDCPYCWQQDVQGEKTGSSVGVGFGPKLPDAVPVRGYKCQGCGMEWSSMEWYALARKKAF
ncbi:MAG: hypothetical protein IH961_09220 [Chloroflexi bacterium]|nr:hypothetical protein [Chloroflexota bacterium]